MQERKMTEEEIQALLDSYAKSTSPLIKDEIVYQYSNLVESVARRFACAAEPIEDLAQEGYIGLLNSIDRYDQSKGVKFSTYATHFIIGQMKHYLRDKGKIIKEPAWLQELGQRVSKTMESLYQELNRQPTEKEIAESLSLPERTIRELISMREVFKVSSLDGERENPNGPSEAEKVVDDSSASYQIPTEDRLVLESALDGLKDIEQKVIYYHYYRGLNQTEIAHRLDISCNYVSHIIRNGTKKLRKILTTEEIRDAHIQRSLPSSRMQKTDIERATVIDESTGLYNATYLLDRLDEEISKSYRHSHKVAFALLNVCLPPDVDPLVRELRMENVFYIVGQKIRDNVRKMDIVGRYNKNTIGIIFPHTGEQVDTICDRLCEVVNGIRVDSGRRNQQITPYLVTAGTYTCTECRNRNELLDLAEQRLEDAMMTSRGAEIVERRIAA